MSRRDRSRRSRGEADTVGFAGWLYADLFLLLFVVGLAMSVVLKDASEVVPPRPTTTTTTTTVAGAAETTTTTLPPCSTLLNTNEDPTSNSFDQGIYIELKATMPDETLVTEFMNQLSEQSAKYPELTNVAPEDIELGFIIVYGGNDNDDELVRGIGKEVARTVIDRLRVLMPDTFLDSSTGRSTVFRVTQTTLRNRGVVGFDVYPFVQVSC